jgi:2-methylisocitrate lyase-like PEP mutase family enzyme
MTLAERRATFRRLHQDGCFLIPNPWDAGSARLLEGAGFKALASTSAGFAWSVGQADYGVTLEQSLAHLQQLAAATELPLTADFENAFADAPEDVAVNVRRAADTGVAGLSVEDAVTGPEPRLYPIELAVERIRAAKSALDGLDVMLTARTEGLVFGCAGIEETVERIGAYAEAGADVLYAPALVGADAVARVIAAARGRPVNINIVRSGLTVPLIADLGARRVSVGGALARAAWGGFMKAVDELKEEGAFRPFEPLGSFADMNAALRR